MDFQDSSLCNSPLQEPSNHCKLARLSVCEAVDPLSSLSAIFRAVPDDYGFIFHTILQLTRYLFSDKTHIHTVTLLFIQLESIIDFLRLDRPKNSKHLPTELAPAKEQLSQNVRFSISSNCIY